MLRFVWGLPRQQIKHYWTKVVTFGLISSPYEACTCLKDTAKIHSLMYALAAAIIIGDSYMDDIASSAISVAEGRKLIKQILTVMDAGGFRGHKISTSDPAMVEGIPPDQVDPSRMDLNSIMIEMSSCLISTRNSKTTTRMRCEPRVKMSFR